MDNIILTPRFIEPKDKYNILSVVLFCLKKSYKNQDKYFNGLKGIVENVHKIFPTFYLRIYYDKSVITPTHEDENLNNYIKTKWLPLFERMKKLPFIQLMEYDHPDFRQDTLYHTGLFGHIVRFIPLFNYPFEHSNNVITMDIDLSPEIIKRTKKIYDDFMKSKSQFFYRFSSCSSRCLQLSKVNKKYVNFIIPNAWDIMIKNKFDYSIFDQFVNQIKNPKVVVNDLVYDLVISFYKSLRQGNIQEGHHDDITEKFPYGMDEVFTAYLFNYFVKRKMNCSYTETTNMGYLLYDLSLKSYSLSNFNKDQNMIYMMKYIMGKYYDSKKSLSENYIFYDYIVNKQENRRKIKNPTLKVYKIFCENEIRFTKEIVRNNTISKYHIDELLVKCISNVKQIFMNDNIIYENI
jgi:hypothetical protein